MLAELARRRFGQPRRNRVGGVSIEGVSASVIPPSCAGISVARSILHVFERYASFPSAGDEGHPQRVRRDLASAVERRPTSDAAHHAPGFGLVLHSPDFADLAAFQPEASSFGFLVQVIAGPNDHEGEESFDVIVCSPTWLSEQDVPLIGRHHLIVNKVRL